MVKPLYSTKILEKLKTSNLQAGTYKPYRLENLTTKSSDTIHQVSNLPTKVWSLPLNTTMEMS